MYAIEDGDDLIRTLVVVVVVVAFRLHTSAVRQPQLRAVEAAAATTAMAAAFILTR